MDKQKESERERERAREEIVESNKMNRRIQKQAVTLTDKLVFSSVNSVVICLIEMRAKNTKSNNNTGAKKERENAAQAHTTKPMMII